MRLPLTALLGTLAGITVHEFTHMYTPLFVSSIFLPFLAGVAVAAIISALLD